jgi:biopolymer transport protein ExbB
VIDRLIQIFDAGGIVMYPLLLLSIIALGAVIERVFYWSRHSATRELRALDRYAQLLGSGQRDAAAQLARKDRSPLGRLVAWSAESCTPTEESVIVAIEALRPALERFSTLLAAIIASAPLLGILGTVVGIIESFDLLGDASSVSDPSVVAGGIAEALYTTAAGLTIALLALYPAAWFRARASGSLSRLESLGALIASSTRS